MIKTPLSTMIGGAFWTPKATILGGTSKTFDRLIKSLFANGEQGFVYDPNDLSTMFQDAAGTVPVTGVGQPVGLMLDKSRGLVRSGELFDDGLVVLTSGATRLSAGRYRIVSQSGEIQQVSQPLPSHNGRYVEVSFNIESITGTISTDFAPSPNWNTTGLKRFYTRVPSVGIVFKRVGVVDAVISDISVREIQGNHAYQTTSSMRPLLVASPQRLDYDIADDKLITNLSAQLTGCTVIRSVPNVGTQIMTGQTIPTPYNDNTDHCGLVVINRALTTTETSQITKLFNKAAGV